eukprot:gene12142-12280_t
MSAAGAAADLLTWLDSKYQTAVMQNVHQWLEQHDDGPIPIQVGSVSDQVQQLINQQLAMTAAEPAAAVDMVDAEPPQPPVIRATLKMTTVDVAVPESKLPCCGLLNTAALQEDVTGRLMAPCQQLWVTDLCSATGRSSYSSSRAPLLVQVPEDQVGQWQLGAVVQIIGHASLNIGGAGVSCSVQFTQHQQQHPLQLLWDLLNTALGYEAVIDAHVAVALLLSAASVGCATSHQQKSQQPFQQVNLLLVHEQGNPSTCRLLRQVAALLSPQSVALPVPLAEHVLPVAAAAADVSDEIVPKAVYASLLLLANAGVAVAELPALTSKSRQQLLEALHQQSTPLTKDCQRHQAAMPVSATCWAAAPWEEVCRFSDSDCQRKPDRATAAAAAKSNYGGFDLLIADNTFHEEDIFAALSRPCSSNNMQPPQAEQDQKNHMATASLRYLVAAAVGTRSPVLSDDAQSFLGKYFLLVRQALDNSSKVSKAVLLASLLRAASAVARLHLRSTVLECPDAVVAVVLMEQTLSNKLGSTYPSLLELPCDLSPTNDRTLDEQVQLLHSIISNTFKQHCSDVEEVSAGNAGGCFMAGDEDSGADDQGGGVHGGRS